MARAHPLLSIDNRSRNKRRNLWVGRCVSSWWPWFPSRSSVLIYMYIYICMYIPYTSSVIGRIYNGSVIQYWQSCTPSRSIGTVPERKCVTKIRVRYHDPRWRRQQPVRMFTPRFLLFRIVFHVFDAGYRAIVSYCFYVIPESVIEFDKTAVNWCTKNTEDLGNSSMRSW